VGLAGLQCEVRMCVHVVHSVAQWWAASRGGWRVATEGALPTVGVDLYSMDQGV